MSRVPMGSDGGPWALDPETNINCDFIPQGIGADLIATIDGYSRADVDPVCRTITKESSCRSSQWLLQRIRYSSKR